MSLTIGSLCTGYGGLDMAAEAYFGAETVWTSDIDPGACKIIAHRYPQAPNLGDIQSIDWSAVPPVDILAAGYPCTPFSHAGKRRGGSDERHLWPYVREAIRHVRPRIAVLENVAGHRSLGFGRVLGDLAEDGLDVRWTSLRAADVGAPHGRERVFLVVADPRRLRGEAGRIAAPGQAVANAERGRRDGGPREPVRQPIRRAAAAGRGEVTPPDADRGGRERLGWQPYVGHHVDRCGRADPDGDAGESSPPADATGKRRRKGRPKPEGVPRRPDAAECRTQPWGVYEPTIRRWEQVMGRHAPRPVEQTRKGTSRLSPWFDEWLMGLPDGWVCDVPGLSWNEALAACGNGVVPQQALEALRRIDAMGVAA